MSGTLPRQWLDRAAEDLEVARLALREGHTAHACFLSQQCIEKSLKAFLIDRDNSYPRTHKLVDLLSNCRSISNEFADFESDCIVIDQYYIPARYPDGIPGMAPGGFPSQDEAQEALSAAERVFGYVASQLQ